MKNLVYLFACVALLTGASCRKESCQKECKTFTSMTIIKDCTGTYLRDEISTEDRVEHKDYKVVNPEILNAFGTKSAVSVCYHSVDDNNNQDKFDCEMLHPHQGFVKVEQVQ